MANISTDFQFIRAERFTHLVAAYNAARRWELPNTIRLFENRLQLMGATMDEFGYWQLDGLPAAGRSQPY